MSEGTELLGESRRYKRNNAQNTQYFVAYQQYR